MFLRIKHQIAMTGDGFHTMRPGLVHITLFIFSEKSHGFHTIEIHRFFCLDRRHAG
ncbi:MAG: hypothetical protein RL710_277, partial [Pseudomonadota bacterium]